MNSPSKEVVVGLPKFVCILSGFSNVEVKTFEVEERTLGTKELIGVQKGNQKVLNLSNTSHICRDPDVFKESPSLPEIPNPA